MILSGIHPKDVAQSTVDKTNIMVRVRRTAARPLPPDLLRIQQTIVSCEAATAFAPIAEASARPAEKPIWIRSTGPALYLGSATLGREFLSLDSLRVPMEPIAPAAPSRETAPGTSCIPFFMRWGSPTSPAQSPGGWSSPAQRLDRLSRPMRPAG